MPVRQYVDIPKEVVRYVPKVETRVIEKKVEVPGETIEIPVPLVVEKRVIVPKVVEQPVNCVVAQTLKPVISESETAFIDVEMREFNPVLVTVDVLVPRYKHMKEHPYIRIHSYTPTLEYIPHTDTHYRHIHAFIQTQKQPHTHPDTCVCIHTQHVQTGGASAASSEAHG